MRFVDFYFDFSSTNSYFAAFLLPEICARNDARVNWMPTHSAALFRGTGFDVMAMTPRKARYLWRDHARYAELTGLPFRKPSRFPIKTASALRAVLAAGHAAQPDDDGASREQAQRAISQAIMRAYWERDEDISDRGVLASIASSAGFDGAALMRNRRCKAGARRARSSDRDRSGARRLRRSHIFRRRRNVLGQGPSRFRRAMAQASGITAPASGKGLLFATLLVKLQAAARSFDVSKRHQSRPTVRS